MPVLSISYAKNWTIKLPTTVKLTNPPDITEDEPKYRNMHRPKAVSAVCRAVYEQVYKHASAGKLVLTLGGDHSIAIGTVAGSAAAIRERLGRELAVIWVDAHADINTPESSETGHVHGMPLAFLTGLAHDEREDSFGWIKENHRISTRKLVYIALRDIDRGEKALLRKHNIRAFTMHEVDRWVICSDYFTSLIWLFQDPFTPFFVPRFLSLCNPGS